MQELGCSCKGRGGRKGVNLLSGSQFITSISEMSIGAWLMGTMLQGQRFFQTMTVSWHKGSCFMSHCFFVRLFWW